MKRKTDMQEDAMLIIEEHVMEMLSISEVCINSINHAPEKASPFLYLYFFELIHKKLKLISNQF